MRERGIKNVTYERITESGGPASTSASATATEAVEILSDLKKG